MDRRPARCAGARGGKWGAVNQIAAAAPPNQDPGILFWMIACHPMLIDLLLAGAKATPGRKRGGHLGNPLFTQWPVASGNGWDLRLHCFHRDDPDACHNHAWEWRSLVLKGGYWDVAPDESRQWREPGALIVDLWLLEQVIVRVMTEIDRRRRKYSPSIEKQAARHAKRMTAAPRSLSDDEGDDE